MLERTVNAEITAVVEEPQENIEIDPPTELTDEAELKKLSGDNSILTLLQNNKKDEVNKSATKKVQKYKAIYKIIDQSLETFNLGTEEKQKREVEEVQFISLTEGRNNMLDITIGALEMVSINRNSLPREQLIALIEGLLKLTIKKRE